jgi:hypothetical protein
MGQRGCAGRIAAAERAGEIFKDLNVCYVASLAGPKAKGATALPGFCPLAYRLGYRSQRESPRDRSSSRAFALRGKIGGEGGIGDYIPKPKGMHARTFKRAMQRVYAAEGIVDAHADLLLDRLKRVRSQ